MLLNWVGPSLFWKEKPMHCGFLSHAVCALACVSAAAAEKMEAIAVSADGVHFVERTSGRKFVPWGFNYDRDSKMRLLEDYWEAEWPTVEADFREMKRLGANVVRIHLQLVRFMEAEDRTNEKSLAQLSRLLELAEQTGLRLDLTGLGCYHRKDVPAWYDKLTEADRWKVQTRFWEAVAARGAKSPAVFCYDLMNEPVAPGELQKSGDWLVGPPFGGKQYVQFIALDPQKRPRAKIAQAWVRTLVEAIRKQDRGHLITVGLLPGTPDRADAWSGFDPKELGDLDYLSVHIYPKRGEVDAALKILARFAVGKPVVIEETFPLECSVDELGQFFDASRKHAAGWIGFYWGRTPEELRQSKELADHFVLAWLEFFEKKGREWNLR
jgi:hypothetical protein